MKAGTLALMVLLFAGCHGRRSDSTPVEPASTNSASTDEAPLAEEVQFQAAGMTVFGTITRPSGAGRFPAIAIAAGSGPTDRDWLNPLIPGPNGSGKLLAEDLAAEGIVVLRYDKRGTGKTGMPPAAIAWGDYVTELNAALGVLAGKDYVDPTRVYVAGHSEGGTHALRAAAQPAVPLAGVILLSAAGRTLRDIVIWQISNQLKVSGLSPAAVQSEIVALTTAVDSIADGRTVDPQTVGQLQGVQQFLMALQNPQSVDFARGLLRFDPLAAFGAFDLPVLIVSGDRDIQVDPDLDAKPLASAAEAAGRSTELSIVEGADHVLKAEQTQRAELTPAVALSYNAQGRQLEPGAVAAVTKFVTAAR